MKSIGSRTREKLTDIRKEHRSNRFVSLFFRHLTPLLTLFLLIMGTLLFFSFRITLKQRQTIVNGVNTGLVDAFVTEIGLNSRVLLVLADSVTHLLNGSDTGENSVPAILRTVLETNCNLFQARYLDSNGMEIYRFERGQEGLFQVAPENLQDKQNRYYFSETVKLSIGSVYISPLDLNIEHGELEIPWRPTIRLSTPITDPKTGDKGIVILNVDFGTFLDRFSDESKDGRTILLNSEGFYLAGVEKSNLFSFMFAGDHRFQKDFPDIWDRIRSDNGGLAVGNGRVFVYTRVGFPLNRINDGIRSRLVTSEEWIIVAFEPLGLTDIGLVGEIVIMTVLIVLAFIIAWIWTRIDLKARLTETRARSARRALVKSRELALLGRMIAGMAHELNTPIGTSLTVSSSIQDKIRKYLAEQKGLGNQTEDLLFLSELLPDFSTLDKGLDMAVSLVSEFKDITLDHRDEQYQVVFLTEGLRSAIVELQSVLDSPDVEYILESDAEVEIVSYRGTLIQSISTVLEYISNQAFPAPRQGRIFLEVEKKDDWAVLVIRHNGETFSDKDLEHLYQPFAELVQRTDRRRLAFYVAIYLLENLLASRFDVTIQDDGWTRIVVEIPDQIRQSGTTRRQHDVRQ